MSLMNTDQALLDVKSALTYVRNSYWPKWEDAWKLYRNERINIGYKGVSDTFDPMTFTIVETKLANVFGSKPRVEYYPHRREQNTETKVLTQLFNHTWDMNRMSSQILPAGRELFITGNMTVWGEWDTETNWIKLRHIPIRDCLFDPTAKSPHELRYAGYRYLTMLDDLKEAEVYDAGTNEKKTKYSNLDKIKTFDKPEDGEADETQKEINDCYEGSVLDDNAKKDQVEITCVYYVRGPLAGQKVEIANRQWVVYAEDTPYQKAASKKTIQTPQVDPQSGEPMLDPMGQPMMDSKEVETPEIKPFIPMAMQRNYVDGSILLGMGEVEPISEAQELLNDTLNQKRDNLTHIINNRLFVDPKFKDLIPKIKNIPNAVYAIPPGAVSWEQKSDMTAGADTEAMRIKDTMRTASAMDEVVMGMRPQHDATATQINAQVNQAGQRFGITLQALESEFFTDLASVVFKMIQVFVSDEQVIRLVGRKGVDWLTYSPDEYWGNYEPTVMLDQTAKAQRDDEIKRIEQTANILMNNPYVEQRELTKVVLTRLLEFDDDDAESLLTKDEALQQAAQGGAPTLASGQLAANPAKMPQPKPQAAQQPIMTPQEKIIETIDFADLPEDAKQQVLAQMGIQSNMASPVQQKVNLDGMKVQHEQVKHDTSTLMDLHKQITQPDPNQQPVAAN